MQEQMLPVLAALLLTWGPHEKKLKWKFVPSAIRFLPESKNWLTLQVESIGLRKNMRILTQVSLFNNILLELSKRGLVQSTPFEFLYYD